MAFPQPQVGEIWYNGRRMNSLKHKSLLCPVVLFLVVCFAFASTGAGAQNLFNSGWVAFEDVREIVPDETESGTVTARFKHSNVKKGEKLPGILDAQLIFRVDGGEETSVEMEPGQDDDWVARIPPQPTGAHVEYYLRATNEYGNVTSGAFLSDGDSIHYAIGMMDSDEQGIVDQDLNITSFTVGYNKQTVFIKLDVKGNISAGTLEPRAVNLYLIKISSPDVDVESELLSGGLLVIVPLAEKAPVFGFEDYPEEYNDALNTGVFFVDVEKLLEGSLVDGTILEAQPGIDYEDGCLTGHLQSDVLDPVEPGYLRFMAITARNDTREYFMPVPDDMSSYFTLHMKTYEYTVQ